MNSQEYLNYYNKQIRVLETERNSITKIGHITTAQGLRLTEIDSELNIYFKYIDALTFEKPSLQSFAQSSS